MDIIIAIVLLIIVFLLFYKPNKKNDKDKNSTPSTNQQSKEPFVVDTDKKYISINDINKNMIVDSVLKNNNNMSGASNDDNASSDWTNPMFQNIDPNRNKISGVNQQALDALIREVNVGNTIPSNTNNADLFKEKSRSINSAKNYRQVNYKDSNYRMDFNGDGISQASQDQLDKLYSDALIFHDSEYENNSNFTGMPEDDMGEYASAGISPMKPQTQKEKIMNMYNSNNYLPNKEYENKDLTKGFQILENPTSVSNPNLIPVLRAMPVSSTLGSKRNASWDLRGDVPNPKTVVAPWNNSSINPDVYSSNRGCL